jgi:hypothetical protein
MKYFLLIVLTTYVCSCNNKNNVRGTDKPVAYTDEVKKEETIVKDSLLPCMRQAIARGEKEIPPNPPVSIEEYNYNGKKVYLWKSQCCDQFDILMDDSCNTICAPTGGITGRGDGKCTDFMDKAKMIKTIWKSKEAK